MHRPQRSHLKTASMATIGAAYEQLRRDCAATVSEEVRAVASAKAKDGRLLEQLVVLHNEIAGELHDFDNHEVDAKTAFAFVQRIAMQIEAMGYIHTDGITSYTRDFLSNRWQGWLVCRRIFTGASSE